ncbi:MAG: nitrilase-related carbon-nitrogen hydrolase [Candidatus Kapaibacterium sp.]|jgi:predicted amidohydrolase|nr:carbon-nitrogen hydrolase [Candidatus Kapabacteria bacterium]
MELSVALIQQSPLWANLEYNCQIIQQTIHQTDADILVFPELATSGYFFTSKEDLMPHSIDVHSDICKTFHTMAREKNAIIVIGFAERDKDTLYNSAMLLFPHEEKPIVYRKTHLFYKEFLCFSPGNTGFFVVEDTAKDIRVGTMICYDWRFPESARTLGLRGADIIVCPSNLVTDVWHIAMPCRALENKVYMAVANRYGTEKVGDEELTFKGESALWGYNGAIMAKALPHGDAIVYGSIQPELTRSKSFNSVNDIFRDRRPEMYV